MNPFRCFSSYLCAALAFTCLALVATAEEGMWTFDNFPTKQVQQKFGWAPDQAWLDRVQASAVRLTGGCSASFVSPEGLVLTNHHCVSTCIQQLSTADQDYIENGFIAESRDQERLCPGQQAEVVTSITDVTPRVQTALGKKTGAELAKARDAETAAIENESCKDKEKEHCQVVTLYGGGQYKLYRYRKYSDVRLVWAPEQQAAFFGGDPDNFNFPRYNLDAAFLRAYENGKPAATPQHLKWNPRAPEAGEPTFVVGNPGSTQRLFTTSQFNFRRDLYFPTLVPLTAEYRGRLLAAMEGDPEKIRTGNDRLHSIENSYKVFIGQSQALRDEEFRARLSKAESELRERVKGKAEIGDPWTKIDQAVAKFRPYFIEYFMFEERPGWRTDLYMFARELVRSAIERDKPATERLPAYAESRLPLLEKQLTDEKPSYPWLEELTMAFWLSKTRELLTADDPRVKELLGKESPEQLAKRLVSGTKLGDAKVRKELWTGGLKAVQASQDPMIQFALAVEKHARPILDRYRAEYDGPVTVAQAKLATARFAAFGETVYPDATFSLRISYGSVEGWNERGKDVPFATQMSGAFERATGAFPYNLATKMAAAEEKIDKTTVYNFVTTNDIIGGNSGSPVIARDGSVLGAAFDGNIHSLGGSYGYDPRVNRTVVVSSAAVQEALEKIYVAPALIKELNDTPTTKP
ncbi:S46 family peptidase [soil metagenome]